MLPFKVRHFPDHAFSVSQLKAHLILILSRRSWSAVVVTEICMLNCWCHCVPCSAWIRTQLHFRVPVQWYYIFGGVAYGAVGFVGVNCSVTDLVMLRVTCISY